MGRNEQGKISGIKVDCDLDKEHRNGKVSKAELSYYQCSLIRSRVSVSVLLLPQQHTVGRRVTCQLLSHMPPRRWRISRIKFALCALYSECPLTYTFLEGTEPSSHIQTSLGFLRDNPTQRINPVLDFMYSYCKHR